jgi:dihydroorotate dehydrogenase
VTWIYRGVVRPLLFAQESERIHDRTLRALGMASHSRLLRGILRALYGAPELPIEAFGLRFPNPVGLAAGMDKTAEAVPIWEDLGFGFSELGGVTRHAQPGNDPPRMFRIIPDRALINRMGFNNPGAETFARTLKGWRDSQAWPRHPVGVNLGKSRVTPMEEAAGDYLFSFERLRELADFFVINVSSPNTPNLQKLQDKTALDEILSLLTQSQRAPQRPAKPLLVKVAPDLGWDALDEIVALARKHHLAGIVATNTTLTRPATRDPDLERRYREQGGLSGRPLAARSTDVIRHLHTSAEGTIPIIGVGGIFNARDAWEKITAGATLVQVYTGMVYEGPAIARSIVRGLKRFLAEAGLPNPAAAVGTQTSQRSSMHST